MRDAGGLNPATTLSFTNCTFGNVLIKNYLGTVTDFCVLILHDCTITYLVICEPLFWRSVRVYIVLMLGL